MDSGHSILGASGSSRWLACPGSVGLIRAHGLESEESAHARLGTAAHKLADMCLSDGTEAWEKTGHVIDGFAVGFGDERIDPNAVQVYLDYCRDLAERADWCASEFRIGLTYKPSPYFFGTADFVAVAGSETHVVDFKFGEGIGVSPVNNPQMLYYAWGLVQERALERSKDDLLYLTIVQPRYARGSGEPETWVTTIGFLTQWAETVLLPGMERALSSDELADGEHCRFCPAKLVCPRLRENLTVIEASGSADNLLRVDDATLDDMYLRAQTAKLLIRAIEARMQSRLMEGAKMQHAKLTWRRTTRVWKDGVEERLTTALGDDAFTRELKSPAQIEKLGKRWKQFVAENAFLPPATGYTLVPATDSAPAADPVADLNREFAHYQPEN